MRERGLGRWRRDGETERKRKEDGGEHRSTIDRARLTYRAHNQLCAGAFLRTCARACAAYRRPRNRDNVIDDDIERRSNRPRAFLRAVSKASLPPLPPSLCTCPLRSWLRWCTVVSQIDSCTDANGRLSPLDINDG